MTERTEFAPAKVNLGLRVTGKRADGYHLLDSLVAFASVGDEVRVSAAPQLELHITGPEAASLRDEPLESNLVWRAAAALREVAGVQAGARLELVKHLPVASGIGGGSADAAAALRLLNRFWNLYWPIGRLMELGLRLGADVPVCLYNGTCRMRGIGEELTPATLDRAYTLLLVNPRRKVATGRIFAGCMPTHAPVMQEKASYPLSDIGQWSNDLQPAAENHLPEIASLCAAMRALPGAKLVRMSGSGATCFSLFEHETAAQNAHEIMTRDFPAYWVKTATIGHDPAG